MKTERNDLKAAFEAFVNDLPALNLSTCVMLTELTGRRSEGRLYNDMALFALSSMVESGKSFEELRALVEELNSEPIQAAYIKGGTTAALALLPKVTA